MSSSNTSAAAPSYPPPILLFDQKWHNSSIKSTKFDYSSCGIRIDYMENVFQSLETKYNFPTRKNDNQSRYTKNQEQRRKLDTLLASNSVLVSKRDPTDAEVADLVWYLRHNNIAEFGLLKLSNLNLNTLVNIKNIGERTLLQHAVFMNKDKIAIALLRAGANPCVSIRLDHSHFPLQYVVWLMRYELSHSTNTSTCDLCNGNCVLCVEMSVCNHMVCSKCFWSDLDKLDGLHHINLPLLPVTDDGIWTGMLDSIVCCTLCGNPSAADTTYENSSLNLLLQPPETCKSSSHLKWLALPDSTASHNKHAASNRDRAHCGMHLSEMAQVALGGTQSARLDELRKGVARGDLRRVAALVEAGVHLDSVDEYGMTVLMLAVWLKHTAVCRLLLAAGADSTICDLLGNSAMSIAVSAGSDDIVHMLNKHGTNVADMHVVELALNSQQSSLTTTPIITTLIPHIDSQSSAAADFWSTSGVKGAEHGAFHIDSCFSPSFLSSLLDVHARLTVAPSEKAHCASRSYFCDVSGGIVTQLESVIRSLGVEALGFGHSSNGSDKELQVRVFPQMRFLHYTQDGSALASHVDLSHKDVRDPTIKSTHTLILYLTDCVSVGGETLLLRSLCKRNEVSSVASVTPQLGRLLIFPHFCPHEGRPIRGEEPKLLLRGEVYLSV